MLFVLAPEIVWLLLGDAWSSVVAPFQVLALALVVRSTCRMSDALSRATGAVYQRAWRQSLYAGSVILFSWIGQHFGLVGLALGATAGMVVNFFLMTHLSVGLAQLSWGRIILSHLGALPLLLVSGVALFAGATLARHYELHPLVVIVVSLSVGGMASLLALRAAPRLMLGTDGVKALATLAEFGSARFPSLFDLPLIRPLTRSWLRDP
jgi:PST family polysaccharide transporter